MRQAVRAALGDGAARRVLDIGCGTSRCGSKKPGDVRSRPLAAADAARGARSKRRSRRARLAEDLAALGHDVTAVDNAPAAVAACERRAAGAVAAGASSGRVSYRVADVTSLPFDDGAFDAVVDKGTLDVRA